MKKQQVVVIHGGNAFDTYEEYLNDLKTKDVSLEKLQYKDWKKNLPEVLGDKYQVILLQMPNASNARYLEWKIWFERFIPLFDKTIILIGHSLGGIFLAKYLSENKYPKKIKATFLVAAPFNTKEKDPLVDFNLPDNFSKMHKQAGKVLAYHSKNDFVVPFSNLKKYQKVLPKLVARVFKDKIHFNQETFPEIVEDIMKLN
jgi:predicted alpha/beta hydrolase family esterase